MAKEEENSGADTRSTGATYNADLPVPRISHARDWTGPDDQANPRNFSLFRRCFSTVTVTLLAFTTTFAASIYSPGSEEVAREFGCSAEVATLPLSLYNLGLAFGPLIGSPLSETAGRKLVLLVNTPLFVLFTLGAGFSPNIVSLIICRFLAGVFSAPAVGNASATLTDYTSGRYRAISFAFYYSIPTFGAVLGPLVGGFVVKGKGWRWTQWTIIFFVITFYIPLFFVKESYKKTILQRRAKRLGVEGPPAIKRSILGNVRYFATTLFFRPLHMLLTEPIVTLVCVYNAFLFGLIYTYVVASPWVYEHYYDFGVTGQSLSFLGLVIGTASAPLPLILIDHYIYQPRLKQFNATHSDEERFPPEQRLFPAMIASSFLPVGLFLFAWTSRSSIHWIVPIFCQGVTAMASLLTYASANLYMMDAYGPLYGASAAGAAMLSRYLLSAAFPLFSLQLYKGLGVGWATSLLAFCTLLLAPIPWLFWRCGERIRSKSKYETSA
jgi:MFS transporter, DHA1 family, multidrug resistance protein